ncbi:hypothetical protein IGI04_019618 [Brassica rapa subsp. trilocularis]|uniref:Uncharacterized protein n=1 Tax=Brassica rapa subsp. trilocularis TaxID=1813537 RepID=A0ABQ7MGD8_BRACM|nr:hypothetical protein IGI04_019618 [Brassica rapa subsp. trilocularis]
MTRIKFTTACQDAPDHCFRTNTVSGLVKAGCLVVFSLTLFVPGFGDIRKLCVRVVVPTTEVPIIRKGPTTRSGSRVIRAGFAKAVQELLAQEQTGFKQLLI